MNASVMSETEVLGDAELVERSRAGDREAFGQVVARYQSFICALAYNACGDLARSEDLAQETFLAAWRGLRQLNEPARLGPWLCGIVRNLIRDWARRQTRNPLSAAVALEEALPVEQGWSAPSDQAMSREEEAILWRVLEGLPRAYREPLVLFYRCGESTAKVAAALEMSEDAVRQRLSRGRAMLSERVARVVESGLRRSGPTPAFASAVLAALPATSGPAAAAATVHGAGTLKALGGASALLPACLNLVPMLAGVAGLWGYTENTRSQRERRFVRWGSLGLLAWAALLGVAAGALFNRGVLRIGTDLPAAIGLSLLWVAFAGPLDVYVIWMARRQKQIRAEAGPAAERPAEAMRRGFKVGAYGSLGGMIFGLTSWLFLAAVRAHDAATAGALAAGSLLAWLASARAVIRRPAARAAIYVAVCWGLALTNLAVVNLRWGAWHGPGPASGWPETLAPAGVNLLILVLFGSIRAGWFLKARLLNTPSLRRDCLVAAAAYLLILLAGWGWLRAAQSATLQDIQATQVMINEIQPDGTIRFQSWCDYRNEGAAPLAQVRFINSDCVRVERMADSRGRPLAFTSQHEGGHFRYVARLNEPVPPGGTALIRTEGLLAGQVRDLGQGVMEFSERHWPANGMVTRRLEIHRLPRGAEVLATTPANLPARPLRDGRLELRADELLPPHGSFALSIRFRAGRE